MAYEEVTSPILTDATGQEIVDQLEAIAQAMQPPTNIDASDVDYDNTQSGLTATDAQAAIDENAADITEIKSNLTELQPKAWTQVIRTAQNTFNIPIDAKEVILIANMGTSGGYTANMITFHIPNPRELPIDANLRGGYAQSATVNLECDVYAKTNGDVQLYMLTQNGANHYEAWSRLIIYYR